MTPYDAVYHPDFDLGNFRHAVARYIKLLIRARWKCEPGFLSQEDLAAWQLQDIEQDSQSSCMLLDQAAQALAHLNVEFLPRCGSGGICETDDSTAVGRLIGNVAGLAWLGSEGGPWHNSALVDAARMLRENKEVDWGWLVDWEMLQAIRADLNQLPQPRPKVATADNRLTLDDGSLTIILDGTPYSGIDQTAFQIFKAIWNATPEKVSSTKLRKLRGLRGKNIRRVLREKLPGPLSDVVKGARGAGYSIVLPFLDCS
jgi:hypothetical protein